MKKITITLCLLLLTNCTSWQATKAPCSFEDRHACGKPVELNQVITP